MGFAGAIEEEISDADNDIVDDLSGCDDVREPGENLGAGAGNIEEREAWEADGNTETIDRHALFRAFPQKVWGVALKCQAV